MRKSYFTFKLFLGFLMCSGNMYSQSNKIFGNVKNINDKPIGNAIVDIDNNTSEFTTTNEGYFEIIFVQNKNNQVVKNVTVNKPGYDPIPLNRIVLEQAAVAGRKSSLEVLVHKKGEFEKDLRSFLHKRINKEFELLEKPNNNEPIKLQKQQFNIQNLGIDKLVNRFINLDYENLNKDQKNFYKSIFFTGDYKQIDSLIDSRSKIREVESVLLKSEEALLLAQNELSQKLNKIASQDLEDALVRFMYLDFKKIDDLLKRAVSNSRGDFKIETAFTYASYLQTVKKLDHAEKVFKTLLIESENRMNTFKDSINYKYNTQKVLLKLGILSLDKGEVEIAIDYFDKSEDIQQTIEKAVDLKNEQTVISIALKGKNLQAIGLAYIDGRKYNEAKTRLVQSIEKYKLLIDNGFDEYTKEIAYNYLNIGRMFLTEGNSDSAILFFNLGLDACKSIDLVNDWSNTNLHAFLNLGIGEAMISKVTGNGITTINELSDQDQEIIKLCENYMRFAYEKHQELYSKNSDVFAEDFSRSLISFGKLKLFSDDLSKAEDYLQQALTINKRLYNHNFKAYGIYYAESLRDLALLYIFKSDFVNSELTINQSLDIFLKLHKNNPAYLNEIISLRMNLLFLYRNSPINSNKELIKSKAKKVIKNLKDDISGISDPNYENGLKDYIDYFNN